MKKRQREKLLKRRSSGKQAGLQRMATDTVEEYKVLATEVWRLRRALATVPSANAASLAIPVDRLEDVLRSLKLEIHDPTGEAYDDGMTLSVSLFEKSKTLPQGTKRIVETISPTVYWNGQMLQVGKVIVEIGDSEG
jgi:hypothetical protein